MDATQSTTITRAPERELARLLQTEEFRGYHGQVSYHGCYGASIQLFRPDGSLACARGYRCQGWGDGDLIVESPESAALS